MRARTFMAGAAASTLAATIGLVAPTTATAAPAATPPLIYTTYVQTSNGGDNETVNSVGYDATAHKRLAATSLVISSDPGGGSSINGTEIVGPAATSSPDHTLVAWTEADWTPTTVTYAVKVLTRSTQAVSTFPLPADAQVSEGGSYLGWFADNARLVMALTTGTTSTVTTLDLTTGTFTPLYALKSGNQVVSLAVSTDGTIAFTSNLGVALLTGVTTSVKYLHRTGKNESCTVVRARPGAKHEFAYLCTTFGSAGQQVLRSQTSSGTARTIYSADTSSGTSPVTFLDAFAWAPSGASLALVTTSVRSVDKPSCTNALTTTLSTVTSTGTGSTTLQTEPTITAQTCRGNGYGDVDPAVWSADGQTVVFLHAPKFLGPMSAYAVRPAAPQTQTVLAKNVIDLSS